VCSGPLKVVFMSSDNEYGVTYKCSDLSEDTGVCGSVTIDVISRTRDLLQDKLTDVMGRVGSLCTMPSKFHYIDHTGMIGSRVSYRYYRLSYTDISGIIQV